MKIFNLSKILIIALLPKFIFSASVDPKSDLKKEYEEFEEKSKILNIYGNLIRQMDDAVRLAKRGDSINYYASSFSMFHNSWLKNYEKAERDLEQAKYSGKPDKIEEQEKTFKIYEEIYEDLFSREHTFFDHRKENAPVNIDNFNKIYNKWKKKYDDLKSQVDALFEVVKPYMFETGRLLRIKKPFGGAAKD